MPPSDQIIRRTYVIEFQNTVIGQEELVETKKSSQSLAERFAIQINIQITKLLRCYFLLRCYRQ